MIFYFNVKNSSQIDPHIIFISVMKYIFIIAGLKFMERKHEIVGFFNIYIGLVLLIDIGFTCYNYMKYTYFAFPTPISLSNQYLKNSVSKTLNFENQIDEIIDSNFDLKNFNKELDKFNDQINSMIKKKSVKIIKKDNSESENDLKEFNKNISKANQQTQSNHSEEVKPTNSEDVNPIKEDQTVLHISSLAT